MIASMLSSGRAALLPPVLAFGAPSAKWLSLLVVLIGIALPDCCLNGRHIFGEGMDTFGLICRARF
jgi:hypothetical protein